MPPSNASTPSTVIRPGPPPVSGRSPETGIVVVVAARRRNRVDVVVGAAVVRGRRGRSRRDDRRVRRRRGGQAHRRGSGRRARALGPVGSSTCAVVGGGVGVAVGVGCVGVGGRCAEWGSGFVGVAVGVGGRRRGVRRLSEWRSACSSASRVGKHGSGVGVGRGGLGFDVLSEPPVEVSSVNAMTRAADECEQRQPLLHASPLPSQSSSRRSLAD